MKTVYISFCADINLSTTEQLIAASFDLIQQGNEHLYYLFSTTGGFVSNGITLYNTLKALPVHTTMHNVGNVDSIGNAVFLAGKERFACPNSTFMFHGVGFNRAGQLEEKECRETLENILVLQRKIGSVIAEQTPLKGEIIESLFREASTRDAQFALDNGFIQAIKPIEIPKEAQLVQLTFNR